jgi:ABC-type multidrug transport system fused ATPase/permease subunit
LTLVARWSEAAAVAQQGGAAAAVSAAAISAKYLGRLVNAAVVVSVFLWIRSFITMKVGVRASEFLHSRMLSSVFAAPMTFFDATPSGQLLSRFGKEIETVDKGVPDSIMSVIFCVLAMSSSIAALTGVITPAMLVPLAVVGILYAKTMSIYRRAGRDMKRAETKTRSPIYTHFGEALRGVETIRSIPGSQRFWSNEFRSLSDFNLRSYFTVKVFDRWLTTRLENLGNAVVFATAVTSVLLTRAGRLGTGAAGWGLTQSLAVTGLLTWAVRCFTDLETNMLSVVRVKELSELESQEAVLVASSIEGSTESLLALRNSSALVESGWPWKGNVRFNNVSMRYNPVAPLVLQNVDLDVPAGTSIGLVG